MFLLITSNTVAHLALRESGCENLEKGHSNKMMKFLSIVYLHGTMNYMSN